MDEPMVNEMETETETAMDESGTTMEGKETTMDGSGTATGRTPAKHPVPAISINNLPHPVKTEILKNLTKTEAFNMAKAGANISVRDVTQGMVIKPTISLNFAVHYEWEKKGPYTVEIQKFTVQLINESVKSQPVQIYWTPGMGTNTAGWTLNKNEEGVAGTLSVSDILSITVNLWNTIFRINANKVSKITFSDLKTTREWGSAATIRSNFKERFRGHQFPNRICFDTCSKAELPNEIWAVLLENDVEIHNYFGSPPVRRIPKGHTKSFKMEMSLHLGGKWIDDSFSKCFTNLFYHGDALRLPHITLVGPYVQDDTSKSRHLGGVAFLCEAVLFFMDTWMFSYPLAATLNNAADKTEHVLPRRYVTANLVEEKTKIVMSGDAYEDMAYIMAIIFPKRLASLRKGWAGMEATKPWMRGPLHELVEYVEHTMVNFHHKSSPGRNGSYGSSGLTLVRKDNKTLELTFQSSGKRRLTHIPTTTNYNGMMRYLMNGLQIATRSCHGRTCDIITGTQGWDIDDQV